MFLPASCSIHSLCIAHLSIKLLGNVATAAVSIVETSITAANKNQLAWMSIHAINVWVINVWILCDFPLTNSIIHRNKNASNQKFAKFLQIFRSFQRYTSKCNHDPYTISFVISFPAKLANKIQIHDNNHVSFSSI